MTRTTFDHSNCEHPRTKTGRAKCRLDMRAAALAESTEDAVTAPAAPKPVTRKRATAKPAAAPAAKKSPRWVDPADLDDIDIHPSMRVRITHGLDGTRQEPYLG